MANQPIDTTLLDKAIMFAVKAHSGTERRGKGFPYIVHPMEAVEIVSTMTSDQELLAAAALHDTVEDTHITLKDLEKEFGQRIASIVAAESDTLVKNEAKKESWEVRKRGAIERLAKASTDVKIVALGDKLSNMRAIARDYSVVGEKLWEMFHAPHPSCHKWHYEGLAQSLKELEYTFAYKEFITLIEQVFGK